MGAPLHGLGAPEANKPVLSRRCLTGVSVLHAPIARRLACLMACDRHSESEGTRVVGPQSRVACMPHLGAVLRETILRTP